MSEKPFLPYAKQSITPEDIEAVAAAMRSNIITRGPKVQEFEEGIASFVDAKYGVAFSSGTAALAAAFFAAETGPFDRVLTSANTFVATVSAAVQRGATPVFIDIDRSTGNLDLNLLSYNLEYQSTRGKNLVVPVHFSGIPLDMPGLNQMMKDPDAIVIEDAAHALGSRYPDGNKVGSCSYSAMTVFSFHPAKHITTGEGGMVTTNDETLFHSLRQFRNNGIEREATFLSQEELYPGFYEVQNFSGNYHLTDFQAALGLSQLARIEEIILKRRELVAAYRARLKGIEGIRLFADDFDSTSSFHLFVVQVDFEHFGTTRKEVMEKLKMEEIGTQVHYIPLYRHPAFLKKCGDLTEYFPEMEKYFAGALSLPLYFDLTANDVERVVEVLKGILRLA